jgi:hypothetical protein
MQDEPQKTPEPPVLRAAPPAPPPLPVTLEVLPPQAPIPPAVDLKDPFRLQFSKSRLACALAVAVISDLVSLLAAFAPPVEWAVDFVTALLLFVVLGWQWILLPGLIMEAIPGLCIFPFWVLVVGAVAVWGTPRPKLK